MKTSEDVKVTTISKQQELTYGIVAEYDNDPILWFEPISDERDDLVLCKSDRLIQYVF